MSKGRRRTKKKPAKAGKSWQADQATAPMLLTKPIGLG